MKKTKKFWLTASAVVLGVAAAGSGLVNAASVPVTFEVTEGQLVLGPLPPLDFPSGSNFSGTWDSETGDLTGTLTVPPFTAAETSITILQVGNATGNISPVSGAGVLNITVDLLAQSDDAFPLGCSLRGISIELSTAATGGSPADFTTGSIGLASAGFSSSSFTCDGAPDEFAAIINQSLGLPSTDTSLTLTLDGVTPPPTTEAPSVETLPATGANDTTDSMAWAAGLALLAGAGLVVATRRRVSA